MRVVDSINSMFDRLGQFLSIFDLSFFISGVVGLGAVMFWIHQKEDIFNLSDIAGIWWVVLLIVAYVFGLVCFAIGRHIGRKIFKIIDKEELLMELIQCHGLDEKEPFKTYLSNGCKKSGDSLYIRLWAEVRHKQNLSSSFALLNHHWTRAASYDGIAVALMLWIIVLFNLTYFDPLFYLEDVVGIVILVILLYAVKICFREARLLEKNQVKELIATVAADLHSKHNVKS